MNINKNTFSTASADETLSRLSFAIEQAKKLLAAIEREGLTGKEQEIDDLQFLITTYEDKMRIVRAKAYLGINVDGNGL